LNQFEDLLTQDGLIITNRDLKTKDELKNYNYSCLAKLLNSRLFAKDKIVRKFFLNNVGFLEDSGLLEKQMDNTATVLHRDFGKSHNNDFNIEEVLEILYRNKSIEEHEGIVPILEIRSEDVFFNNIEKISFQLPHTNIFINFTPVPGNCEYFISMIAEKQRVKNLINRFFKENNGRVLISSNFFNYQTHSHLEYNYIPNSSVIIGVGSSLIVSKLGTILTSALDHEFYNLKISDDSSIEYILIRHYNEFFNYYSILPAASYNVIMFSDILNNYGVQRANTNRLFRHIEYIEPVIFHLDSLGWTPENQIDNESIEHIIYDYNKK
jgi:hypothetical protein